MFGLGDVTKAPFVGKSSLGIEPITPPLNTNSLQLLSTFKILVSSTFKYSEECKGIRVLKSALFK